MSTSPFTIRIAAPSDACGVSDLLKTSYGELLAGHYELALLARALPLISRANPALLNSGRYFVAHDGENRIVGCGGWSLDRPGTGELEGGLAHVRHFATHRRERVSFDLTQNRLYQPRNVGWDVG